MGKKKVVLDTNILVSALGWHGNPHQIFEECIFGEIELVISEQQLDELRRVLNYPKFSFTQEQKDTFLSLVLEIGTLVELQGKVHVIIDDPDDDIILETALLGSAVCIVSGDPHLLRLKKFVGIPIVTASEFLAKPQSF